MTTRGCMLVRYCQARRPTQKTADFADNVLVGHLVSNQPVTGGQTSARSPPLCGAFLGQGHAVVTAGRAAPGAGAASGAGGMWDVGCSAPHGRPHTWSLPGGPTAPGTAPSPALSTLSPCLWDSLRLILLRMRLGACRDSSKRGLVFGSPSRLCGCHPKGVPGVFGVHRPQPHGPALTPHRPLLFAGAGGFGVQIAGSGTMGIVLPTMPLAPRCGRRGPSLITLPAALSPASIPPATNTGGRGEPGCRAWRTPLVPFGCPQGEPCAPRGSFPPPALPVPHPRPCPAQPVRGRRQIEPAKQTPICPQQDGNQPSPRGSPGHRAAGTAFAPLHTQRGCGGTGLSPYPGAEQGPTPYPKCLWPVCQLGNCTKSSAQGGQHGPASLQAHHHLGGARPQVSSAPFSRRNGGECGHCSAPPPWGSPGILLGGEALGWLWWGEPWDSSRFMLCGGWPEL